MVYRRGKKKENNQAGNFFKQRWKTMWKEKKTFRARDLLQRVGSRVKDIEKRLKATMVTFNYKRSDLKKEE